MKTIQFFIFTLMLLVAPGISAHSIHNGADDDHYYMVAYDSPTHTLVIHKGIRKSAPKSDKYRVTLDNEWKIVSITKNNKAISLKKAQMFMIKRGKIDYFVFGDHGEYIKIE